MPQLRRGSSSPAFEGEISELSPLARSFLEIPARVPLGSSGRAGTSYRGTFETRGISTEAQDWMRSIGLLERGDLFRGKTHRESRRGIRKVVHFGGADNRRGDEGFA
jgi:hypothetical protein